MARKFTASEIYEGQRGPMTSENAIHRLSNFYTADDYEQLEAALRELYDDSPHLAEGDLSERIDKLLSYAPDTEAK